VRRGPFGYVRFLTGSGTPDPPAGDETVFSYYPLEVLLPKAGLNAHHRIYRAYPGLEYNIRVAAIGGAYPYSFRLSNQPAGMTISSNGTISWPNPAVSAADIVVTVTDSLGNTAQGTWSITVGASGFVFVDAVAGDDDGAGTLADPWQTLDRVFADGGGTSIVYFRTGTYATANVGIGAPSQRAGTDWYMRLYIRPPIGNPCIWLAYPGEAPVLDLGGTADPANYVPALAPYGHNGCAYFDGFEVVNGHNKAFIDYAGGTVLRRLTIRDIRHYKDGTNPAAILTQYNTSQLGEIVQECEFRDNAVAAFKGYDLLKTLWEDNSVHDGYGGFEPKDGNTRFTCRGCTFRDLVAPGFFGNMHGTYYPNSGEFCFNLLQRCGSSYYGYNDMCARINQDAMSEAVYIYRNTLLGRVQMQNVDSADGPFTFANNVIVNAQAGTPSGSHVTHESVTDASRIVLADNLAGYAADGLVDANGRLVNRALVGVYGHERVGA